MSYPLYYIALVGALAASMPANAQSNAQQGTPQTQPYGMNAGDASRPYTPPARDENGNRIVINGQVIGSGTSNPARRSGSIASPGGSTLPNSTLGAAGVTAVSIGNSVSINGTFGSTIIINQTNNASQTVNVNGTEQDGGN
ncbi:hypothetical protein [Maricaulis sp.]|uniref:hypothetical protein n=1 Tax=unclassified Maricaulis TaxID=2632371 RepID=UPI001B10A190|nr:hypothetical protein [Maricaulis sp.]MBO6797421.1 hypothetical protein [Maricaulis sp.]